MTSNQKAAYITRLETHARPAAMPPRWMSQRSFADPVARFRRMQEAVKGHVIESPDLPAAIREAASVLAKLNAVNVVLNAETPLERLKPDDFPGINLHHINDYEPAAWRAECARSDAGITSAEALLAETGTVVCSSGPGRSRLVSLLPPVHVVLCPVSRFQTDLFTWLAAHKGTWPANTVLVSGPSKTADIEQTMSVGMHGPKKLVVIIYADADEAA